MFLELPSPIRCYSSSVINQSTDCLSSVYDDNDVTPSVIDTAEVVTVMMAM